MAIRVEFYGIARQWAGVLLVLLGVLVYFYPVLIPAGQEVGLAVVAVGVLANAGSAVLGRSVNREGRLSPLLVTVVSAASLPCCPPTV